jgi:hypothetical protein
MGPLANSAAAQATHKLYVSDSLAMQALQMSVFSMARATSDRPLDIV